MPYLTPNGAAEDTICRSFNIPSNWMHFFMGALYELSLDYRWESDGSESPEAMATAFRAIVDNFVEGCGMSRVGEYIWYATELPPEGVLPCDGGLYLRADYPLLYSKIKNSLIVDADSFRTPDIRGRVIGGTGQGTGLTNRARSATTGAETHQLTTGEMPSHAHTEEGVGGAASNVLGELPGIGVIGEVQNTGNTGGGNAHNNMQPTYFEHCGIVALPQEGDANPEIVFPDRVGVFFQYLTANPPAGSLPCDGSTYLKADYPTLASKLHANITQTSTQFTLPDLRGRALIGSGQGTGLTNRNVNAAGGAENHQLTIDEMPAHTHSYTRYSILPVASNQAASNWRDASTQQTGSTGGGGAHNNMQPFAAFPIAVWYE